MTIQMFQCFMTVAETKSYTKASEQLFISQPAVSKYISALEKELNEKLIDRSNRRSISLTHEGEVLYRCLLRCKKDFEKTMQTVSEQKLTKPIIINLLNGYSPSEHIIEIFKQFMGQHNYVLYTHYINYNQIDTVLEAGEMVLCEDIANPGNPFYEKHTILSSRGPYRLLLAKNHPVLLDLAGEGVDLNVPENLPILYERLAGSTLLLPQTMPEPMVHFYQAMTEKHLGRQSLCHFTDTQEAVLWNLEFDRGFTIIPAFLWHNRMEEYASFDLPAQSKYQIIWKENGVDNPLYRELLKMM